MKGWFTFKYRIKIQKIKWKKEFIYRAIRVFVCNISAESAFHLENCE